MHARCISVSDAWQTSTTLLDRCQHVSTTLLDKCQQRQHGSLDVDGSTKVKMSIKVLDKMPQRYKSALILRTRKKFMYTRTSLGMISRSAELIPIKLT